MRGSLVTGEGARSKFVKKNSSIFVRNFKFLTFRKLTPATYTPDIADMLRVLRVGYIASVLTHCKALNVTLGWQCTDVCR